jgi:transcriptional regulator with XRE-family HTH domain
MSILVHKQIKKFRLASNMSQKKLASAIGISNGYFSHLETGLAYPPARHIAKLNELGANIRPSVFSRPAQLITAVLKTKIHIKAYLRGVQTTEYERHWIITQLYKKGIKYISVAEKAGCNPSTVSETLSGQRRSIKVQSAFAEVLGYCSFEELLETCRQRKGGAA